MTTVEILRAARELISDPARWTKGACARDRKGEPLYAGYDPQAVRWCAFGAVEKIGRTNRERFAAVDVLNKASYSWLPAVNDNEGREAVISVYDRAIALAEQEEVAK